MLRFECYLPCPDEDTAFPRHETSKEILEDLPGEKILPLGGGGGTYGGTMISRIEDVIHGLDPAEAADTGGVANEPAELNPNEFKSPRGS